MVFTHNCQVGDIIVLRGLSLKGKNRVREHGSAWRINRIRENGDWFIESQEEVADPVRQHDFRTIKPLGDPDFLVMITVSDSL